MFPKLIITFKSDAASPQPFTMTLSSVTIGPMGIIAWSEGSISGYGTNCFSFLISGNALDSWVVVTYFLMLLTHIKKVKTAT